MPSSMIHQNRCGVPCIRVATLLLLCLLCGPALADGLPIRVHPPLIGSPLPFTPSAPRGPESLPIVTPKVGTTVERPRMVERLRSLIDDCRRSADHTPRSAMPPECGGVR